MCFCATSTFFCALQNHERSTGKVVGGAEAKGEPESWRAGGPEVARTERIPGHPPMGMPDDPGVLGTTAIHIACDRH